MCFHDDVGAGVAGAAGVGGDGMLGVVDNQWGYEGFLGYWWMKRRNPMTARVQAHCYHCWCVRYQNYQYDGQANYHNALSLWIDQILHCGDYHGRNNHWSIAHAHYYTRLIAVCDGTGGVVAQAGWGGLIAG